MKVKDLIKYLSDFNPDAELNVYIDKEANRKCPLYIRSWESDIDDLSGIKLPVEKEKLRARFITLSIYKTE